ncbi:ribosome recycling factor family protein [Shewanella sp. AS16]|uniref:ribosome recycling factor family protein n=1 Tax=Shewanella sp. AS16 TaxID=2907625 RepID=UPI001F2E3DBE|nr:ribosome recycling factor family protein [Shewanella sp. AS16]MCE9685493.1 ribosome recycling factor family protein [Shewanella sp. AS16]
MNKTPSDAISIALPSLIHRIGREAVGLAQVLAKRYGCELRRVRRSRNWCLVGEAIDIQSFTGQIKTEDDAGLRYLVPRLDTALGQHADKLESMDAKLARLIQGNPNVTLGELMQLTQCSITQARLARFQTDLG